MPTCAQERQQYAVTCEPTIWFDNLASTLRQPCGDADAKQALAAVQKQRPGLASQPCGDLAATLAQQVLGAVRKLRLDSFTWVRRTVMARENACGEIPITRTCGGQGAGSFTGLAARLLGASPCRERRHKNDDWQLEAVLIEAQHIDKPSARPGARCILADSRSEADSPCPPSVPYWYVRRV